MKSEGLTQPQANQKGGWFPTTHWSVILHARDPSSSQSIEALEKLCQSYWYPLYAFVRREGKDPETAKDLTQAFFERLVEKSALDQVDQSKGKFRSFLLASMRHFLADEWDKAHAQKRGGGKTIISLDQENPEERYLLEPVDEMTPEKLFDRRWALETLGEATERLKKEFTAAGKAELFEQLRSFLTGVGDGPSYAEAAARFDMTEGTLKSMVHRMRVRNRQLLREVIANTVASPDQIDEELKDLVAALST